MDTHDRSTHERVRQLKLEMQRRGWSVWFDEDQLLVGTNLDASMCAGVRAADTVCVCLTRAYIEKINSQHRTDNCVKEFNLAVHAGKRLLPLVMEPDLLNVRAWPPGIVAMYLGSTLFLDASGDDTAAVARELSKVLAATGVRRRLAHRLSKVLAASGLRRRSRIRHMITL